MADYDPPNTGDWDGEVGYDGAQGDQEILQDSTEQDQHQANYTRDQSVNVPGDSPVADDADDDAGEYDPASVTEVQPTAAPAHAQGSLKPSPQPATKKQRSLGGFLVVDSDSEEEEPATSVHGSASQANLRTSIPPSPLQTSVSNDAIGHQAAEAPVRQDTSSTQHAGSTRGVGKSNGVGINYSSNPGTTTPFYRPQDKVQTLEERIRDDPRGAVNEWLALIAEHRVRHDMESARHVHERFLNIFPQGVSPDGKAPKQACGVTNLV